MFDLSVISKAKEIKEATGKDIMVVLKDTKTYPKVLPNTITAFMAIGVSDLVEMVNSVPLGKLVHGLSIINSNQIKNIPVEKLKFVLKYGNMDTVAKIQSEFRDDSVELAIKRMSLGQLKDLLVEDSFEAICSTIRMLNGIIEG